jgi:hypothetical protein
VEWDNSLADLDTMNSKRTLIVAVLFILADSSFLLLADDWKTTDGKVYQDVKVVAVAPDTVTILHRDGGTMVPLATLSPDLQKRFYYDPVMGQAAAEERAETEAAARRAMRDHELEAEELQAQLETEASDPSAPDSSTPTGPIPAAGSSGTLSATHYFLDALANLSLQPDASDTTHHTIDDLSAFTQTMRRDLTDPTYHTMAHQAFVIRVDGLGPDRSDPNHHTIDEIGH